MYMWQAVGDALGDLLIELSSTSTATRWTERRRGGRASTSQLRPRAASCSRPLTSNKPAAGGPAAADAAALSSKSLSHNQLHVNPSSSSDLARAHSSPVQLRHKSHQQLEQVRLCNSLIAVHATLEIIFMFIRRYRGANNSSSIVCPNFRRFPSSVTAPNQLWQLSRDVSIVTVSDIACR